MAGYGWEEYDARTGGRQVIHDKGNHIDITTELAKVPGGQHGGSWGLRISGKLRDDAPSDMASTVVFYLGMEGLGMIKNSQKYDEQGYEDSVFFDGETQELGTFKIEITPGPKSNAHPLINHPYAFERTLERTMVTTVTAPVAALWQAKQIFLGKMRETLESLRDRFGVDNPPPPAQFFTIGTNDEENGNIHFVQKTFRGSFQFDVLFSSESAAEYMTPDTLSASLKSHSKAFHAAYKERFPPRPPFNKPQYISFCQSLFSNLLGGIGYFYGDQVIDRSYADEYDEINEGFWEDAAEARGRAQHELQGPYTLFTSVPSRPFFPRGFLWDEGFHLLPLIDWDVTLVLDILQSWFTTMDDDGWIPREQILGPEARSKVPAEFQVQYPHYANPPTLFLTLEHVLDKLPTLPSADRAAQTVTLATLYPLFKRNYAWYRRTQRGDIREYDRDARHTREAYRWRGRTPTHILTSGLDDYPRAQPPHPGELHVDLISWLGMSARALKRLATLLGDEDAAAFAAHEVAIRENIHDLHWDADKQAFCDVAVDAFEESTRVCHIGYVSLFPFLTGLLEPDSPEVGAVLDTIRDPEQLWSAHGVRSLSRREEAYGTGENYWRSPVWVNINYLVLVELLRVVRAGGKWAGKAKGVYGELRRNLVETVFESWKETGFAWEQYEPDTGAGQRTHHFTGWTSLVVRIVCLPEAEDVGHGEL